MHAKEVSTRTHTHQQALNWFNIDIFKALSATKSKFIQLKCSTMRMKLDLNIYNRIHSIVISVQQLIKYYDCIEVFTFRYNCGNIMHLTVRLIGLGFLKP